MVSESKAEYEIAQNRHEDERETEQIKKEETTSKILRIEKPGVDSEVRFLKKVVSCTLATKQVAVDQNGMIYCVGTTTANEHDSQGLISLLEKLPNEFKVDGIFCDKGYQVPKNKRIFTKEKIKMLFL
jgi:IS5 family transposase